MSPPLPPLMQTFPLISQGPPGVGGGNVELKVGSRCPKYRPRIVRPSAFVSLKTPPKKEPSSRTQCDCSTTTGPRKVASPAPTTSSSPTTGSLQRPGGGWTSL